MFRTDSRTLDATSRALGTTPFDIEMTVRLIPKRERSISPQHAPYRPGPRRRTLYEMYSGRQRWPHGCNGSRGSLRVGRAKLAPLRGQARYRFLGPIRQYAHAKLRVSGESPAVTERHANFYCELSERLSHWPSQRLRTVDAERQREFANFRVAMSWALESNESQLGLRLAASLGNFWRLRWLSEGREWFTPA
jgi:hypothetical protein